MTSEFVSLQDIAIRMGVSDRTVRNWTRRKRDPLPHMQCGRTIRIPAAAFDAWLARHTIGATR